MPVKQIATFFICNILSIYIYASINYTYIHYGSEDGLSTENIYDVEQDSNGYIWIAFESSLARFNGLEFVNFTIKDGLPKNEVVSIQNDGDGNMWLNLSGPFSYYNGHSFLTIPNTKNDISWNFNVLVNSNKNTWINRKNELFLANEKKDVLITNELTKTYENGVCLIGRYSDTCLIYFNSKINYLVAEKIVDSLTTDISALSFNNRSAFCLDYPNLYYMVNSDLMVLNVKNKESKKIVDGIKKRGRRFMQKVDNSIIYCDSEKGFKHLELDSAQNVIKNEKKLSETFISNFFIDKSKNLWICSHDNGLFFFPTYFNKKSKLINISNLKSNNFSVIKNINDTIWIASKTKELIRLTKTDTTSYLVPINEKKSSLEIYDFNSLSKNVLLLATNHGYFTFNESMVKKVSHLFPKKIFKKNNRILLNASSCLVETNRDTLLNYNMKDTNFNAKVGMPESKMISNERTYTLLIDDNDIIWMSNNEKGLVKLGKQDTIYFRSIDKIFNANIVDMINLENNFIAVVSNGFGITIINTDTDKYININEDNNLISNVANSIDFYDDKLYVAANTGISVIDVNENIIEEGHYLLKLQNINSTNGLVCDQIKDIAVNKAGIHMVGRMGYQFLNHLSNYTFDDPNPEIYFENIRLNGDLVELEALKNLNYNQNHIQINYSANKYGRQPSFKYAYRLKGIEQDWIPTTFTEVNYSNLSFGEYTFEIGIKPTNEKEVVNIKEVFIKIKPHYTQSKWFLVVLEILLIAAVLLIMYNFFSNREKSRLNTLIDQKTNQLNNSVIKLAATNKQLEQSNRDLQDFAYICSHDLKSPLRNISSFSELLHKKYKTEFTEEDKEFYGFVQGGLKKMEQIINDLMKHSKVNNDRIKTLVNFNLILSDVKRENELVLKEQNAEIIEETQFPTINFNYTNAKQLFENLILNAIKYNKSEKPIIKIGCKKNDDYYQFYVNDNGIGIEQEYSEKIFKMFNRLHNDAEYDGTGIGLAICKRIIEKFDGKIWVESEYGNGSTFYFTINHE